VLLTGYGYTGEPPVLLAGYGYTGEPPVLLTGYGYTGEPPVLLTGYGYTGEPPVLLTGYGYTGEPPVLLAGYRQENSGARRRNLGYTSESAPSPAISFLAIRDSQAWSFLASRRGRAGAPRRIWSEETFFLAASPDFPAIITRSPIST